MSNQENSQNRKSWVPGIIRRDFFRKIIALFFAILVYSVVYVQIGKIAKIEHVPVELEFSKDLISTSNRTLTVTLTVRASQKRLSQLNASDFSIFIPVSNRDYPVTSDDHIMNLPVALKYIKAPMGVTVTQVTPEQLSVGVDRKVTKKVKVESRLVQGAKPPLGYVIEKITITPPEITISGPSEFVKKIDTVYTDPIPVDKTTIATFQYPVSIAKVSDEIELARSKVLATVEIKKDYDTKIFQSIPIQVLSGIKDKPFKVELVTTPHVEVTVEGPQPLVEALKPEEIKIYADISSFDKPGAYTIDLKSWIDKPKINIKSIYPSKVEVKLTK